MNVMNTRIRFEHGRSLASILAAAMIVMFSSMGCGESVNKPEESAVETAARATAELSGARIFFAHQSVGENIVEGVGRLEAENAGVRLAVMDPAVAQSASGGFLAHARLGRNGDPKGKTDAFVAALESGLGSKVDIALQKYCYVDFDASTNVEDVFAHYKSGIDRIRQEFPRLKIVHVTAPLMAVQSGPKATIKKLLGRAPDHYVDNLVREQFNALLRREYEGREPVFDLAALEGTRPGQPREALSFDGKTVYALLPEYTTDGGHLTPDAQRRMAAALLSFLARVRGSAQAVVAE